MLTLIVKDITSSIHELRVLLIGLTMVILASVITAISLFDYQAGIDAYQVARTANRDALRKNAVYGTIRPKAINPPEPLSILCEGINPYVGNTVDFDLLNIPYKAENLPKNNPYTANFIKMDFSKILMWLLSIIALFVSYDAISREREQGTIKLILMGQLSRVQFFLSKYVSCAIITLLFLVLTFLIVLCMLFLTPWMKVTSAVFLRILILFFVSCLYTLIWIGIGTGISIAANSSSTSLILSLAAWVALMIVIPTAKMGIVGSTHFVSETGRVESMHDEIMAEYKGKSNALEGKCFSSLIANRQFRTMGGGIGGLPVVLPNRPTFDALKRYHQSLNRLKMDCANKKYRIAEEVFLKPYKRKVRRNNHLALLSPASMFEIVSMKIAKTSFRDHIRYLDRARQYHDQVINYLNNRNAFSSARWFNLEDEVNPLYDRIDRGELKRGSPEFIKRVTKLRDKWLNNPKYLPIHGFPIFTYTGNEIHYLVSEIWVPTAIMVLTIAILLVFGFFKILKYDLTK